VTTCCRVPHHRRPSDAILALCRPHAPAVARGEENVRGGGEEPEPPLWERGGRAVGEEPPNGGGGRRLWTQGRRPHGSHGG
jgi:hypothetical protein